MSKYIFIIFIMAALSFALYHTNKKLAAAELKAANYRRDTVILTQNIRRIYDEKILLENQNAALEEAAGQDQTVFDWSFDISHTAVIKRLQQH